MKKIALATLLFAAIIIGAAPVSAQTATSTPVPTSTGPFNESQGTLYVCADSAILDFTGTSLIGYDIFYQIFSGGSGSGTALTNLRQVPVAGEYAVSDTVSYNSGLTVAAGGQASALVSIARESDSSNVDFSYTLVDTQDGCGSPANTVVDSTDTSGGSSTSGTAGVLTSILAPDGTLNPNLSAEPDVVIGARQSDNFRSDTPGLIFAECDAYPLALPGIIYDTDTVTIYWSWYTKTQEQMDAHIANAIYSVKLNTADLPMTTRSEPEQRGSNYWVFYTANVGHLTPGHYEVGFLLTWANPVNDGYSDFGPGTATTRNAGICNFDVTPNPDGTSVVHNGMYFPTTYPTHNISPDA